MRNMFFINNTTNCFEQLKMGNKNVNEILTKDDLFYDLPTSERVYVGYTYHKL